MHPTLQILERHTSELATKNIHWFDLPEPSTLVKESDNLFNLNDSERNSAQLATDHWPCAALNILFMPKAKDRLNWWLSQLLPSLSAGKKLWLVGENNGGIKSIPKRLKNLFECDKIDTARHCVIFELSPVVDALPLEEDKYFSHNNLDFSALPGVFSAGKLDKGTLVLFESLPTLKGKILEFGAGCGVLTTEIALQEKVTAVSAVEIDLLAVRSAQKNLTTQQLDEKCSLHWSDGLSKLPQNTFDAIVTNPPFHQGIKTEYGPTEALFRDAHQWLKPKGQIIWVANDFLNYQSILEAHFHPAQTLSHQKGFKVYCAHRK